MNNKGFTLIELLAVILILTGISLVAVAGISSSLSKRNGKECEEQIELAKNAAKIYFSLNGGTSVTIANLKSGGYFNETSKMDKLKDADTVSIVSNSYTFTGTGTCTE